MIKYFNDKEFLYTDDILKHLRSYNTSCTGKKTSEIKYYYIIDNDKVVGSVKTTLSWDWIGLGDIFYENKEVLQFMLSKVCDDYKGCVVGIKYFTEVQSRVDDFIDIGFKKSGYVEGTPKVKGYYYLDLITLNIKSESKLTVITQKEKNEEYNKIVRQEIEDFNKENDIPNESEDISIVALDNDVFVGGVHGAIERDVIYISLLVVNKDYRGQDVGTKLMTMIEDEVKQKDVVRISLGTSEFQAREFYEKLGFKVVFTRKDFPKGFKAYTLIKTI